MIKQGDTVICVNDASFLCEGLLEALPVLYERYIVRGFMDAQDEHGATTGVLLDELINPLDEQGREHGFKIKRFKKV